VERLKRLFEETAAMRLRVIDIETSGGTPSEIIEIATVDVVAEGGGWRVEPPRARLFRPLGEISVHAMAIHHLTPEMFAADLDPCEAGPLADFVRGGEPADALVAHNAAFERQHIDEAVTGGLDWICTVKGAKGAWPEAPGYSNQVLRYWRGLNLDPALAMPPHRAAPDAWVTAHLLVDLLRSTSVEQLLDWTRAPRRLDRVPFGRHRGQDWSSVPKNYLQWMLGQTDMAEDVVARAREELASREQATEKAPEDA
jgi:exodeoxyribonuclease X